VAAQSAAALALKELQAATAKAERLAQELETAKARLVTDKPKIDSKDDAQPGTRF